MLLARPSDRARLTLRRVCIGVAIIALTGATSAILRMRATYRSAKRYWAGADAVEVLYRLQPIEATGLALIGLTLFGHTVHLYWKYTRAGRTSSSSPPNAGGYTVNEVPQMHAALSSIWLSVRVASFCMGLLLRVQCTARLHPCLRGDTFQGGFYIDALVGIVLIAFSAGIRRGNGCACS